MGGHACVGANACIRADSRVYTAQRKLRCNTAYIVSYQRDPTPFSCTSMDIAVIRERAEKAGVDFAVRPMQGSDADAVCELWARCFTEREPLASHLKVPFEDFHNSSVQCTCSMRGVHLKMYRKQGMA